MRTWSDYLLIGSISTGLIFVINKVNTFSEVILDTFGGANKLSRAPEKRGVIDLQKYKYSWPKSLKTPVMLGFDHSGRPFITLKIQWETNYAGTQIREATLSPNKKEIWEICWGYNTGIPRIGNDEKINYNNLKIILMGKELYTHEGMIIDDICIETIKLIS